MKNIRKMYNLMVNLSKFTFNKKIRRNVTTNFITKLYLFFLLDIEILF